MARIVPGTFRVGPDLHQQLAEIAALQHADQGRGRVLEAFDHVLLELEPADRTQGRVVRRKSGSSSATS